MISRGCQRTSTPPKSNTTLRTQSAAMRGILSGPRASARGDRGGRGDGFLEIEGVLRLTQPEKIPQPMACPMQHAAVSMPGDHDGGDEEGAMCQAQQQPWQRRAARTQCEQQLGLERHMRQLVC